MKRFALTLCTFFLLIGCESAQSVVIDTETSPEVSIYNQTVSSDLHTIHYLSDNMDRGNHEYFNSTLIVEPRINKNELNRGTIVFVDEEISRIIGLPNESVKIDNGKVLIDGVQLDTFMVKPTV
ncbi:putative signal peptidase I [Bacillus sp. TS-2]|nr:putative signal peptidase I [Bacillus sp. TS-2]